MSVMNLDDLIKLTDGLSIKFLRNAIRSLKQCVRHMTMKPDLLIVQFHKDGNYTEIELDFTKSRSAMNATMTGSVCKYLR